MMLSYTEENYLKALLKLASRNDGKKEAGTNEMAASLGVKPATANDMFKKLKEKNLVDYKKYGKISLTPLGEENAINILRRHRLWETFLFQKLDFSWDEVHEVAEQLEHIQSPKLVEKLEEFLGFPEYDPHGDPIPRANGDMLPFERLLLADLQPGDTAFVVRVKDTSNVFLQYLQKLGISIGTKVTLMEKVDFDGSMVITIDDQEPRAVSLKFSQSVYMRK